jgi:hypothetical protein
MLAQMQQLAEEMRFEEAESIKRKYILLENYRSKSEVVSNTLHNIDVFNIENDEKNAYINYLHVVNGCINQAFTFEYSKKLNESAEELLIAGIGEMRARYGSKSGEIIVPFHVELKLDDVEFNHSLFELEKYSFSGCTSLTSITLPENLSIVGEHSFTKCTKLREITILGEETILKSAFSGITSLSLDVDNLVKDESHIHFNVLLTNTKMIEKFKLVSFIKEIGIGGLTGDFVTTTVYLNGIKGVVTGENIEYKEK